MLVISFGCNTGIEEKYHDKDLDSIGPLKSHQTKEQGVTEIRDSLYKQMKLSEMYRDTITSENPPVKVISASPITKEYSNYKDIRLSWKNISDKTITAIKFKWIGINAFGEPAEMGGLLDGVGGGFSDDKLRTGKIQSGTWNILSRDLKKVIKAWPYEVVFEDGTKWEEQ